MNIMIINGCNLNFLGIREPEIYGDKTYKDLQQHIKKLSKELNFKYKMYQSNYEGKIINLIQKAYLKKFDSIIINPGAFTHYSIGILDAIKSVNIPTVEVHLSDISKREGFRQNSLISSSCLKTISGLHFDSYTEAIKLLLEGEKHA